jgi:hypothetical protein
MATKKSGRQTAGAVLGVIIGAFSLLSSLGPWSLLGVGAAAAIAPSLVVVAGIGMVVAVVGNGGLLVGAIMILAGHGSGIRVARIAVWTMVAWCAIATMIVVSQVVGIADSQMRAAAIGGAVGAAVFGGLLWALLLVLLREPAVRSPKCQACGVYLAREQNVCHACGAAV